VRASCLNRKPVFAQRAQQWDEDAERVVARVAPDVQQQARIERSDVKVQHVPEYAFLEAAREAALEGLDLRRHRARIPGVVVLLQKEQIDLDRGAAQRRLLQQDRKRLGLLEIGRQQQVGDPLGFAQIVAQVGEETRPVVPVGVENSGARQVGALGAVLLRDAEIDGDLLQPVRRELARGEVVQQDEQIGVDHGPARQIAARKIDPALGDFEAAVAKRGLPAETAPRAGHLVPPATLPQIVEVELEQVVPLDRVGIFGRQHGVQLLEQFLFGGIGQLLEDEQAVATAATQADGQYAIVRPGRVAEWPSPDAVSMSSWQRRSWLKCRSA